MQSEGDVSSALGWLPHIPLPVEWDTATSSYPERRRILEES